LHKTEQLRHKTQPSQESNTGYVALKVGERQIASEHLGRAVLLPSFDSFREQIEAELSVRSDDYKVSHGLGALVLSRIVGCLSEGAFAYPGPLPGTEDLPKMADSVLVCKGDEVRWGTGLLCSIAEPVNAMELLRNLALLFGAVQSAELLLGKVTSTVRHAVPHSVSIPSERVAHNQP